MGGETAVDEEVVELSSEEQAAKDAADAEAQKKADAEAAAKAAGEEGGEAEGFDVIEDGGASASAGRVVPIGTHIKLKQKLKGKVKEARGDADAARSERDLVLLENEQLKEAIAKLQVKPMPKLEDFSGDTAKYEGALRQFITEQAGAAATEAVRKAAPAQQATASEDDDDEAIVGYAERAAKLKAPDFEAAEDAVIAAIGAPAVKHLIGLFDNSEAVVYALGKNAKKLAEIAEQIKKSPTHAIKNLTLYAAKLTLKPRGKAPDPDSADDRRASGGGGADPQKTLDRMRDEVYAKKRPMADVLKFLKDCKGKGIKLE